ncbi:MAG TPA: FAD-containing oxidoreductase [Thermoanaerobaculia bacterium]|nr:FAD-containing oxidoreductase [Thermoanaerobaculia bacterium]
MTTSFDAIIIGTGQAGPALAARLVKAGMRIAVVERGRFGGTCVNTGCTPTKTLVASAYATHLARRAAEFGVTLGGAGAGQVSVDMKRVKARKDAVVDDFTKGVEKSLRGLATCTVVQAHARFLSPTEVSAGGERLTAPRIFVNVGGRPAIPEVPGLGEIDYLTSSSMMAVDFLPRHLVIVGGSYIGVEFGQMYRRFGSEVSIVEQAPRLLAHEDEDVSDAVADILVREGIHLHLGARCVRASQPDGEIAVGVDCAGSAHEVRGSHLLMAAGRRPNTDDLGLADAGVTQDPRGFVVVDDELRTNVPGIWALGDCNGRGAFTHTAYNDFEIVAANLLDGEARRLSDRIPTYAVFVDPPLGRAGMTEAEVRRTGRKALIGRRPMTKVSRAIEKGETLGFMKVLVDATDKQILGAAILGTGGDEAVHCLLDVMAAKAPYTVLQRTMHIHPTVAELIPTVLGHLEPLRDQSPG